MSVRTLVRTTLQVSANVDAESWDFAHAGPGSAGSTPMSHEATAAAAANAAAAAAAAVLQRGNTQPSAETMEQVGAGCVEKRVLIVRQFSVALSKQA